MEGAAIHAQGTFSARPETRYARSGDVHIAYQVFGEGEFDLVVVPGYVTHVELMWEHEPAARWLRSLASFARVIAFDRRGSGLSDPLPEAPTLEERMDDVRAVMDAAGSERAALLGMSEGVPMSILFAATYPDRVQALVCHGGMARSTYADDYPWANRPEDLLEAGFELILPHWGDGSLIEIAVPSQAHDPEARAFWGKMQRATASPGMMTSLAQMFIQLDIRDIVPTVHVPALVLHSTRDRLVNVGNGRWLAEHLPDARLVELDSDDHGPYYSRDRGVDGGGPGVPDGRTRCRRARACSRDRPVHRHRRLDPYRDRARRQALARVARAPSGGGARSRWAGSGAGRSSRPGTGSSPRSTGPPGASAARATSSTPATGSVSAIRAGIHTGECEVMGDDIGGIAVHIAARVSAKARRGRAARPSVPGPRCARPASASPASHSRAYRAPSREAAGSRPWCEASTGPGRRPRCSPTRCGSAAPARSSAAETSAK